MDAKNDLDESSDTDRSIISSILKKKGKKLVPLSLKAPQAFSAPVSPGRTSRGDDQDDPLNNSRSSIFARNEGLKSPIGGHVKKPIDPNQQPKSLLWVKINSSYL